MGSLSLSAQTGSDKSGMHLLQQETVTTSAVTISASENRIIVANAPVGSKLEIYSVVGIKVKEIRPGGHRPGAAAAARGAVA